MTTTADLAIAGAGIVGLAVADEALRRGLSVVVVEQDARPSGASVRNFGHGCLTAQTGLARDYAGVARTRWLELRDEAGLWVQECGTVVAARSPEELAVVTEFVETHPGDAVLLTPDEVTARVPVSGAGLLGGGWLPLDLRVDPRQAAPALARHLVARGLDLRPSTSVLGAGGGVLRTSRGDVHAERIVLAVGHDLDRLFPDLAASSELRRCELHMLRVATPAGRRFPAAVLTGTSLLRYTGFTACASSAALRDRLQDERPDLLAAGVNHMLTQHPSGDLLIGDTHSYPDTPSPFAPEELDELILDETRRLLGAERLAVRERWRGVYASSPTSDYLVQSPAEGVLAVAVTSGIGMTTALGLAPAVLDALGAPHPQHAT
jgi:FAD dependent oxidoreductase TIGR03364